jgi:hypothetical protein
MDNSSLLFARYIETLTFRKLLLYPTELRGHFSSYIFYLRLRLTPFFNIFKHPSRRLMMIQKKRRGRDGESACVTVYKFCFLEVIRSTGFGSKRSLVRIQSPRPSQLTEITTQSMRNGSPLSQAGWSIYIRFKPSLCLSIRRIIRGVQLLITSTRGNHHGEKAPYGHRQMG